MEECLRALSRLPPPHGSLVAQRSSAAHADPTPQLVAVSSSGSTCEVVILTHGNGLAYTTLRHGAELVHVRFDDVDRGVHFSDAPLRANIPAELRVRELQFDVTGNKVLVYGDFFIGVVLLPRRDRSGSLIAPPSRGSEDGRATAEPLCFRLIDLGHYYFDKFKLRIVQAKWHSLSSDIVAVLAVHNAPGSSSNKALYLHDYRRLEPSQRIDVSRTDAQNNAEQEAVDAASEQLTAEVDEPASQSPVSFAFGSPKGWQRFAIWVMMRDGTVALVCPVVPEGAVVRRSEVLALVEPLKERILELDSSLDAWEVEREASLSPVELEDAGGYNNLEKNSEERRELGQQLEWIRSVFGSTLSRRKRREGAASAGGGSSSSDDESVAGVDDESDGSGREEGEGGYVFVLRERSQPSQRRQHRRRQRHEHLAGPDDWVCVASGGAEQQERRQRRVALQDFVAAGNRGRSTCRLCCVYGSAATSSAAGPECFEVLARMDDEGIVDILIVAGGARPSWEIEKGHHDRFSSSAAHPIESLDIGGGDAAAAFAPTLLADPRLPWTFHVVAAHSASSVRVAWAEDLERFASFWLFEKGAGSSAAGLSAADYRTAFRKLLDDKRRDSEVTNLLCVMPEAQSGSFAADSSAIVGASIVSSPAVGHLLLSRLASGVVELVNLRVRHRQEAAATELMRRLSLGLSEPKSASSAADATLAMLPPFDDQAADLLEQAETALQAQGYAVSKSGQGAAKMSSASVEVVAAVSEEAKRRDEEICAPLKVLNSKMATRLDILRELHSHQLQQADQLRQRIDKLVKSQVAQEERCLAYNEAMQSMSARATSVLEAVQQLQPQLTRAEWQYRAELERRRAQVLRLESSAKDLRQKAAALGVLMAGNRSGSGGVARLSPALELLEADKLSLRRLLHEEGSVLRDSVEQVKVMLEALKKANGGV